MEAAAQDVEALDALDNRGNEWVNFCLGVSRVRSQARRAEGPPLWQMGAEGSGLGHSDRFGPC